MSFARRSKSQAGIPLEILSAQEEARLIHLGVASGFPIYDRLACVIDIGGGSTEFIVADGERPYSARQREARQLAALRPLLARQVDRKRGARELNKHILATLAPLIERVRRYRLDLTIGTSGTIMGLAALDAAARGLRPGRVHGYTITRERLEELQRQMLRMSESERRRMPGMNPRRSDIIVAGNAILIAALAQLGRDEIVVCERALRDGIIVDMVAQDRALADQLGDERVRRIEAIEALAHHYAHLGGHQRQVGRLAITLFERLAGLHELAPSDRDILYAAAILHSIGRFVAESAHHKHSAYLIRNSPLPGWRDDERELIAQVARYYRKAMPKPSHLEFAALAAGEQTARRGAGVDLAHRRRTRRARARRRDRRHGPARRRTNRDRRAGRGRYLGRTGRCDVQGRPVRANLRRASHVRIRCAGATTVIVAPPKKKILLVDDEATIVQSLAL